MLKCMGENRQVRTEKYMRAMTLETFQHVLVCWYATAAYCWCWGFNNSKKLMKGVNTWFALGVSTNTAKASQCCFFFLYTVNSGWRHHTPAE